jgi:hypothetical protein
MDTQNAIVLQTGNDFLVPAASLESVLATYQWKKDFIETVLKRDVDYGVTPGTSDKPSLKKPGAEKMASFFGLASVFEDVKTVEDWTGAEHGGEPFFYYRQTCKLYRGDRLIGSADGSCNSWEKKYRYRNSERVCPTCGKATIIKGKAEYGGGFICFGKKGGCGAKFADNDPAIVNQEVGQVKNPDVPELVNTILKMAQKRALVAAVLIATNASDYFTQDLDDFVTGEIIDASTRSVVAPKPILMSYDDAKQTIVKTSLGEKFIGQLNLEQLNKVIDNAKDPAHVEAARIVLAHDFQMEPVEETTAS